jgi:NhaP-type Na+/H+ or K+/H+ antiporter
MAWQAAREEEQTRPRRQVIVEGESLFNDGTALVLFGILLIGISIGHLNAATGA